MPFGGGKRALAAGLGMLLSLVASVLASPLDSRQEGCNQDNLLRALLNPTRSVEATDYCNSQLCRFGEPVTATTTVTVHPLYLYNLQPRDRVTTTVTYGSPSTPTAIPGIPACWGWPAGVRCPYPDPGHGPVVRRDEAPRETPAPAGTLAAAAAAAAAADCTAPRVPSFLATTYPASRLSSACSCFLGSGAPPPPTPTSECTVLAATEVAQTTVPQFCNPSFHLNAPSRTANARSGHTATADVGPVADKLDCCARCAGIFDCVAWSYAPRPTGAPSDRFDPWAPGACAIVYNTGVVPNDGGAPVANCPNGAVGNVLSGYTWPREPRWAYLYSNGWNQGPCGSPSNILQSGQSPGYDYDSVCPRG